MKTPNAKKALTPLLEKLRAAGVGPEVTIRFYGGGDEGSINEIEGLEGASVMDDEVREWADALLEEDGTDWYNNEGGDGDITINTVTGACRYTINQNETISNEASSGTFI